MRLLRLAPRRLPNGTGWRRHGRPAGAASRADRRKPRWSGSIKIRDLPRQFPRPEGPTA